MIANNAYLTVENVRCHNLLLVGLLVSHTWCYFCCMIHHGFLSSPCLVTSCSFYRRAVPLAAMLVRQHFGSWEGYGASTLHSSCPNHKPRGHVLLVNMTCVLMSTSNQNYGDWGVLVELFIVHVQRL
uniref:Uncharacterized protein n=1 Tax=Schistocephalus solidus TaxID=70667 RepID=A0A0V0J531_SCHSO